MKLPQGITGFTNSNDESPPKVIKNQFKQVCYTIVTQNEGKVIDFIEPHESNNYYEVVVEVFNKNLHILLNENYPFLAFASIVEFGRIKFIDMPEWKKLFAVYYQVLDVEELNETVKLKLGSKDCILENENSLNEIELKQLAYWKPETIGEVIFNNWD